MKFPLAFLRVCLVSQPLRVHWILLLLATFSFSASVKAQSFTDIATGNAHICGLLDTGEVRCAVQAFTPRLNIPDDAPILTQVTGGQQHSCGITLDGAGYCWGAVVNEAGIFANGNFFGELDIPPIDAPLIDISAGNNHTCAVDAENQATCWGLNTNGQTEPPDESFVKVDGYENYSCGIRTEGDIVCWTTDTRYLDTELVSGNVFADLDLSRANACGLTNLGQILCWENLQDPPSDGPYFDIAVTDGSICGLTASGELDCTFNFPDLNREQAFEAANYPVDLSLASIESRSDIFNSRTMCGIQTNGAIACWGLPFDGGLEPPSSSDDSVGPNNADLELGLTAAVYGRNSVELFWSPLPNSVPNLTVEVFRDDELITTTEAQFSFFDNSETENATTTYSIRVMDGFGNFSPFSNTITVDRDALEVVAEFGNLPRETNAFIVEITNIPATFDSVGLVSWTIDNPDQLVVAGYEIRLNGRVIGFTESTVFVDSAPFDGFCRVYTVAAISPDGDFLGFASGTAVSNRFVKCFG